MKKLEDSQFYQNNSSRILPQVLIDIQKETATLDSRMEDVNEKYYSQMADSFASASKVQVY
jgi:hypothetical protein